MNFFSNKFINLISLIITIFIFLIFNFFSNYLINLNSNKISKNNFNEVITEEKNNENNIVDEIQEDDENEKPKIENWYLKIEKINLEAPIKESVEMEILNNYIGHFEETSCAEGNIGLAAHNRGYKNNYFEKLKDLEKGDEIIYKFNDYSEIYIVNNIAIIRNTDWSYLEDTKENILTLITCTENKPEFRLCVQAVKKIKL